MDLLDHPDAQPLLDDARPDPEGLRPCAGRLEDFVRRYLPFFYRQEQREHARTILRGKLTGLRRKTTEPIATQAGLKRRPLQTARVPLSRRAGGAAPRRTQRPHAHHVRRSACAPHPIPQFDAAPMAVVAPPLAPEAAGFLGIPGENWCLFLIRRSFAEK